MTRPSGARPSPPGDGQICSLPGVDIAEFTRPDRDDDIRRYLHKGLYEMLATGFGQSNLPWEECWHEDRGDGVLVLMPPGISVKSIIHPLPRAAAHPHPLAAAIPAWSGRRLSSPCGSRPGTPAPRRGRTFPACPR